MFFYALQAANTNTSKNLFQLDDPTFIQLLATLFDCSKRINLRQFS